MKKILVLLTVLSVLSACGPTSEKLFEKSEDNKVQIVEETEIEETEIEEKTPAKTEKVISEKNKDKTETDDNKKEATLTKLKKADSSAADEMNEIKTYSGFISSKDDEDEITLYTDADEEDGEFMWDDGNEFLLEIKNPDGEYYTLFDGRVSLGYVYFDVADVDGKMYVLVRNISTASLDTDVFTVEDGVWYETNELDLNDLKKSDINVLYSSAPGY